MASTVDMPEPSTGKPAAEAAPSGAKADELVSKHSYASGQTPPNPDSTRQGEQPPHNANTFAAPKATELQDSPDPPQKLPGMFTDPARMEWAVQNGTSGSEKAQVIYKRIITSEQTPLPQVLAEPQEEDNALGCSEAVDAPDGGQGVAPAEMDWILSLCNGLPVPPDKRQAIARAIYNILDTQIHQTIIESINGSDDRIINFLNEAERENSAKINGNTAASGH